MVPDGLWGAGRAAAARRPEGGLITRDAGGWMTARCCAASCFVLYTGIPVGVPAAGSGVRLRDDLLAAGCGTGTRRGVWQAAA